MKKKYFKSLLAISIYEYVNTMKFDKIFLNKESDRACNDKYVAYEV